MDNDRFGEFPPSFRMRSRSQPPMHDRSTYHERSTYYERPTHRERLYTRPEERKMKERSFNLQSESEFSFGSEDDSSQYDFRRELYNEEPVKLY